MARQGLAGERGRFGFEQLGALLRGAAVDQHGAFGGVDDPEVGVEAVVVVGARADRADEGGDAGSKVGVFEADDMPRAVQPLGQNWTYSWSFTEVFEDEGRGPWVEVNPWN